MHKERRILLGIIALLVLFAVCIGIFIYMDRDNPSIENKEAIQFKEEYEALNNVEKYGKVYKELTIAKDNQVDILTEEETIKLLESGTGILYLGFPECPWCRSMLPVLLQTMNNMNIDKLYYLNILDLRSTFELNEKNKAVVTREGSEDYYKMLELMDDYLDDYYLTTESGKKVNTKEKRIYAPTIVAIKDGKIKGIHVSTVDSQTDPYESLTKEQEEELSNIFIDLINEVYDLNCDEAC